ncbi:unnamed protein product [Ilex paraguariensis]|uniref:Uncharacterized protein n=1 Tax=Ilex paraguariensis TaxID=185542 RepID=A0ABC8S696_9AQUA
MVQPASCMPGLEEWIHYGQYQEPLKKKKKEVFDPKERPSDSSNLSGGENLQSLIILIVLQQTIHGKWL